MNRIERFERRDWLTAALVFGVSLAMRGPLRSQFSFYWDGAQFALAVEHYDLASSLPHPPGYFLYVMLGRLVNGLSDDPHATLVWLSVVFGSALPAVLYLLGAAMFSRVVGLMAATIGATSLLTWFYSLIAYTYVVDGFYVTVFALWCWRARQRGVAWLDVLVLSALYALILGTRQQSGVTLVPLFLYTLWGARERRSHKIAGALLLSGVLVLLWLIPLTASAGGLRQYLAIAQTHVTANSDRPSRSGLVGGLLANGLAISRFVTAGLLLGMPVFVLAYLLRLKELAAVLTGRRASPCFWFYVVWLAPAVVFWLLMFTDLPGHVLSYFCGLAVLTAAGIVIVAKAVTARVHQCTEHKAAFLITVAVVVVNVWAFFVRPAVVESLLAFQPLTNRAVRDNDRRWVRTIQVVRERFATEDVMICHAYEFFVWGFRQFQYHLPQHANLLLSPDPSLPAPNGSRLWLGLERQTRFVSAPAFDSYRTLLLVVPTGFDLSLFSRYFDTQEAQRVVGLDGTMYAVPVAAALRHPTGQP